MKFNLENINKKMKKSLLILYPQLEYGQDGINVIFEENTEGIIEVNYVDNTLKITGVLSVHLIRGFGIFIQNFSGQEHFYATEEIVFNHIGCMMDLSRNSALNTEMLKTLINAHAMLGLDKLYMYMEDVYEIESDPYFGHMRGSYSYDTLKLLDDYADQLGVELVPTIQTLAHLRTFLRWPHTKGIQDSEDILLVDDETTLDFIRDLITSASAPFRTKKIHIGLDEADLLGLGQYLRINGYEHRYDIMLKHLKNVNEICISLGLEVQIWSDMFFRLKSPTGDYYDLPVSTEFELSESIPENIQLIYWDYYHHDKSEYVKNITLHNKLSSNYAFAGGGWTWNGFAPNYSKARATLENGLSACKDEGIRETFCTFWFDNGMETPVHTAIYSIVLYAQSCFESLECSTDSWLETLSGYVSSDFELLDKFDGMTGTLFDNESADNPSKYLFYQDVLQGLFDEQIKGIDVTSHYKNLEQSLKNVEKLETGYGLVFKYYEQLAKVLSVKSEMGLRLYDSYHINDIESLKEEVKRIDKLIPDIEALMNLRELIWESECQVFGYEVLDIRFGGVVTRLKTARRRLSKFISGTIESLPELEVTRLVYEEDKNNELHKLCRVDSWQNMVSAGNIAGI